MLEHVRRTHRAIQMTRRSPGTTITYRMFPATSSPRPRRTPRLLSLLAALAAFVALVTGALRAHATGTLPAPGDYTVDAAGSSVGFSITEFLVNTVNGKFSAFSGKVTVGD